MTCLRTKVVAEVKQLTTKVTRCYV